MAEAARAVLGPACRAPVATPASDLALFSQTARVQHIATLRVEWLAFHEALSISSLCLYNFTTQEWLITPRIGWKLTDAMTAFIGAQVFAGPNDTLFGLIDENLSAGYVELRFSF